MPDTDYNALLAQLFEDPTAFKAKFGEGLGGLEGEQEALRRKQMLAQGLTNEPWQNQFAQGPGATGTTSALGGVGNLLRGLRGGFMEMGANDQMKTLAPRMEQARQGDMLLKFMQGRGKHQDELQLAEQRKRELGGQILVDDKGNVLERDPVTKGYVPVVGPTGPIKKRVPTSRPAGGAGSGGRQLPAGALDELAGFDTARELLKGVGEGFKKFDMGGMSGKAGGVATELFGLQNTKAAEFEAMLAPARQAVGVLLENGKITAGDETKYKNMLPRFGDSQEVARLKLRAADDFLASLMNNRRRLYEGGGYQVPPKTPMAPTPDPTAQGTTKPRSVAEIQAEIDALRKGQK